MPQPHKSQCPDKVDDGSGSGCCGGPCLFTSGYANGIMAHITHDMANKTCNPFRPAAT